MSVACDPLFANVPLLLHLDVAGPYIDSSGYAHTVTASPSDPNVPLDTSVFEFGPGSATFPFGTSTLVIADAPEFDFSVATDWTVELWVRPNSNHDGAGLRPILNKRQPSVAGTPPYNFHLDASNNIQVSGSGPSTNYSFAGPVLTSGTWYALELDRHGNTMTLRVNGVTTNTATISGALGNPPWPVQIGGMQAEGNNFGGWIDEVRFTLGVQRYTADYTPATTAFGATCSIAPSVIAKTQLDATTILVAAGFTLGAVTTINDNVIPPGYVASQTPAANAPYTAGFAVDIALSIGPLLAVRAPPPDLPGALLDAQIAVAQVLVVTNNNPRTQYYYQQQLNQLQVEAVDHYMVTGWLNAATVLATFQPPSWDNAGQTLKARVAFLQALVNNPPVMPTGNHDGFGDSGWTTVLQNYQAALYAAQIALVEHIMDVPGGTSAATILCSFNGSQSFVFEYAFSSVGFTDPGG